MELKAVLFDMDGVIVDSEPEYYRIEMEITKKYGIPFTKKEQKTYTGINPTIMWKELKEKYDFPQPYEELLSLEEKMVSEYYASDSVSIIAPSIELLKKVYSKGVLCAIASSSEKNNIMNIVKHTNIEKYVGSVVSNNDVKRCKPAPDIFLLAAKELGVEPENCVVIEDAKSGVLAANAAGMKVIGFKNINSGNQDLSKADLIVDDMKDITIDVLKNLMV
jgi:HAD superfamily hydrolase (TIGR01509 family)